MSSIDGDDESADFDLQELMYSVGDVADGYDHGNEQVGNWAIVRDYKTSMDVDSVDKHLLDVARNKIPAIVLARLKAKMFGGRYQNLNNVPAAKFLQAWKS
jgi:hypothetical protein